MSVCRSQFPREVQIATEFDSHLSLLSKRTVGSEYVNAFSSTILLRLPSNHDMRLLAGPESA